jgi:nucleotide-binding universal stress UspA family protein
MDRAQEHEEAIMITLKNILVATDFSEPAEVATDYGQDLARSYGATLHVMHVIEDMLAMYAPELGFALPSIERNIEAAVRRDLESITTRLDDSFRTVVVRASNVSHAISEYAKANAIDLIIIGTHGRGAVSRFLMGSVAERVVRSAPCPVLTVHAHERDFIGSRVHDDEAASDLDSTVTNHHD